MVKEKKQLIIKIIQYIGGMLLVALGINITKLTKLGISAISSVPRAAELIWGFTLGTATITLHVIMIILQFVLLRKKFKPINILGVFVGIAFGWMIDLTGSDPSAFGHMLLGFPIPQTYIMRLIYMAAGVIIVGTGVYIYLKPGWVPMASEGLAQAVAEVTGRPFGDGKTIVDITMAVIAVVLQIVFLGGLSSFTGSNVVVREGTIIAGIFIGQVAKFLGCLFDPEKRRK